MTWSTNLDMEEKPVRVVLDTNIFVSGILFGGKPKNVLELVYREQIQAVISGSLLSELQETLLKKFKFSEKVILEMEKEIKDVFEFVYPKQQLTILLDLDDNRVLEAAIEGKCGYIITGDKELLLLKKFKNIKIITASDFLTRLNET